MQKPDIPYNESERLKELLNYDILDTLPEESFDAITAIAAQICQTSISLVSLVDDKRQWFKSNLGLASKETPREVAFCAHAINRPDSLMVVNDALLDKRFAENPLVTGNPNIRFYAGAPLISSSGFPLGTLCVIDTEPKELSADQMSALKALSNQVMAQLELRKSLKELKQNQKDLEEKTEEISRFAHLVSHDLKSPLRAMASLSELVLEESEGKLNDNAESALYMLVGKAKHAYKLVDGILKHSLSGNHSNEPEEILLESFINHVVQFSSPSEDIHVIIDVQLSKVFLDPTILHQILQNLVSNAIKYNDKEESVVRITALAEGKTLLLKVSDNGPGIPQEFHQAIFDMFKKLKTSDRYGVQGTGIGLNTVKRMLEVINGSINIESILGEGTEFIVRIPEAVT
jgi:signal transduction histidine kinase